MVWPYENVKILSIIVNQLSYAMTHKKMYPYYKKKHFVLKPKVDFQQAHIKIVIMTLAVRIINFKTFN